MSYDIAEHYAVRPDGQPALSERIASELVKHGKDLNQLQPQDFAAIDEFHLRGRQATLELAAAMRLKRRDHVLDIGSGLGGPARTIAQARGCQVTGIDLTPAFTEAATAITDWLGSKARIDFQTGNATDLPFLGSQFDAAVSIHTAMNIENKMRLYEEAARVLKPGGLLGIYDVLQGEGGEPHFPVPWASRPSLSHLVNVRELTKLLEEAGFTIQALIDSTKESDTWLQATLERQRHQGPPKLSFGLFLGEDFPRMMENLALNLSERRVRTVTCVARASNA